MGKIIISASLKGGVGKTTLTAALSCALSELGSKVLAVDMDFGVRSLDIALGHENSAGADCYDVIMGKASLPIACEQDSSHSNLYFLAAPMSEDPQGEDFILPQRLLDAFLKEAAKEFDFVFLDMSAGTGRLLSQVLQSGLVSSAFIVCTHNTASIRAAEKLAVLLCENGLENIKLIINSFLLWRAETKEGCTITDIINRSSVPLIGVVPFEEEVETLVSSGIPLTDEKKSFAGRATLNIAKRLLGENVPLFDGIFPKKNRLKFY